MNDRIHAASFRDPSGFIFRDGDGRLLRQVNRCYEPHFRALLSSGLYDELTQTGLLVAHEEEPLSSRLSDDACAVLRPHEIPFLSYPYEWAFSQLKAAALLTLDLHKRALKRGMVLKDASAFNIQFEGTRPVLIDTLSFETYKEGEPWVAYRQFCRHFLAPLALMAYTDPALNDLFRLDVEGVRLDLASRLLPKRTWARLGLLSHLHLHAAAERRYSPTTKTESAGAANRGRLRVSATGMTALVENIEKTVQNLHCPRIATTWGGYYKTDAYAEESKSRKAERIDAWLGRQPARMVWDLGANTGLYSRIAAKHAAVTVAMDIDWGCVEANFRACKDERIDGVLPLWMDLTNPSPAIGWALEERASLIERGPADVVMALALMHHLAIGNNVPFRRLSEFLHALGRRLIIEFVPKDDPQAQRLLRSRQDIFSEYTQTAFENEFGRHFRVLDLERLPDTGRVLYFMEAV